MDSTRTPAPATTATDRVRAYHQRTKHQPQRYAAGPETLDWDAQPNPFRRYAGAPLLALPLLAAGQPAATWADLFTPGAVAARALDVPAVAALLELSLGLTAWKHLGPDRWALRANPSSGNLHPTEAYVLAQSLPGLPDGLYHYAPREHALERRALLPGQSGGAPGLWLGLSSIQWREAWKYGERAFRYCQLDAGHALGALRYAAATLGWQARLAQGLGHAQLAALLGLDREADFGSAEREEPDLLVQVVPGTSDGLPTLPAAAQQDSWRGQANRLDPHPMYRWPVIDEVAAASRASAMPQEAETQSACAPTPLVALPAQASCAHLPAATLIRQRRSAQHFDRSAQMPLAAFARLAASLLPSAAPSGGLPWDAWPHAPRVHPLFYAHRVEGLAPGAYLLPRGAGAAQRLAVPASPTISGPWQAPAGLPLLRIAEHPALAGALRTLSCHQAIASDACLAISLLAEFDAALAASPHGYRELLQEAGLIGQALYLQAEAEGLRGTGIGCYFDDEVHQLLGLQGERLQVIYHFTVGLPITDSRIATEPPYAHLSADTPAP